MDIALVERDCRSMTITDSSAGGSGISPVTPWRDGLRLTNRTVDDQIKCSFRLNGLISRDYEAEIAEQQKELDELDRQINQTTTEIRRMRADLRASQMMLKEADTARDKASLEAEAIRENLTIQEPDSGRIVAYEEVIEV